jgi:transposase
MSEPFVSEELWAEVEPILPRHVADPRGGAPRKPDRPCLEGIAYVLRTGCQWQELPRSERWPSGSTCWRRLHEWVRAGVWPQLHRRLLNVLGRAGVVDLDRVVVDSASVRGKKGGAHTGPSPVDRGKNGCKRHVVADANGVPLLVVTTPANVRDDTPFLDMLDSLPPVKMPGPGRPRYKPGEAVGDAGYGFEHIIPRVVERRIKPLLAPRGKPGQPATHGSGLGKVRYVVERTLAWMGNFRRIERCYERTGEMWQAFNELAACLICANKIRRLNRAKAEARMAA